MTKEKLKGVGGWLIFFIITLIANGLIYLYDVLTGLIVLIEAPLFSFNLFIELGIIVSFTISIIYLFKEDKRGIEILRYALWLPLANTIVLFGIFVSLDIEADYSTILSIVQALGYALIWTFYLRDSERVKNTYYKK